MNFSFLLRFAKAIATCSLPIAVSNQSQSSTGVSSSNTSQRSSSRPSSSSSSKRMTKQTTSARPIPIKRPSLSLRVNDLSPISSRSTPTMPSNPFVLRVLIVDDNPLSLQIMSRILQGRYFGEATYKIAADTLDSGVRVLERLTTHSYDLIFMDLDMPVLSGIEVCQVIRSTYNPLIPILSANRNIPIVAVSADDDSQSMKLAKESGMNGFVPKPANIVDIKKWVEHAVFVSALRPEFGPASL